MNDVCKNMTSLSFYFRVVVQSLPMIITIYGGENYKQGGKYGTIWKFQKGGFAWAYS